MFRPKWARYELSKGYSRPGERARLHELSASAGGNFHGAMVPEAESIAPTYGGRQIVNLPLVGAKGSSVFEQ
jgi:hypothetical protein